MAAAYPVTFDVARPEKFERPQVFLRILVVIVVGMLTSIAGGVLTLVYVGAPVLAAVFISQKGGERFIQEDAPRLTGWLRWLVALDAYVAFLTDRFPVEKPEETVRFDVQTAGSPTVGSALMRLIYSIPSALVLAVLSFISGIVWIIAAVFVLFTESYAEGLYNFQRGVTRWGARLVAYHASLVETYPPFALDTGPEAAA